MNDEISPLTERETMPDTDELPQYPGFIGICVRRTGAVRTLDIASCLKIHPRDLIRSFEEAGFSSVGYGSGPNNEGFDLLWKPEDIVTFLQMRSVNVVMID